MSEQTRIEWTGNIQVHHPVKETKPERLPTLDQLPARPFEPHLAA